MEESALKKADQSELALHQGVISLKGVTWSKGDPRSNLSVVDCSVTMTAMKCFPKEDMVSLDIADLNFAKKQIGKEEIPSRLILEEGNVYLKLQKCLT